MFSTGIEFTFAYFEHVTVFWGHLFFDSSMNTSRAYSPFSQLVSIHIFSRACFADPIVLSMKSMLEKKKKHGANFGTGFK